MFHVPVNRIGHLLSIWGTEKVEGVIPSCKADLQEWERGACAGIARCLQS